MTGPKEEVVREWFEFYLETAVQRKKETTQIYDYYLKLSALYEKRDAGDQEAFREYLNSELMARRSILRIRYQNEEEKATKDKLFDEMIKVHRLIESEDLSEKETYLRDEIKGVIQEKTRQSHSRAF